MEKIMSITAAINVTLKIDEDTYDISLGIPSAAPTADAPYTFSVSSGVAAGSDKLLNFAVGGSNEVYVAVSPPESIMKDIPVVEDISVVVNDGGFDPATGKFVTV
jgi:hypothetical protein